MIPDAPSEFGRQSYTGLAAEIIRLLDALSMAQPDPVVLDDGRRVVRDLATRVEALPIIPEDPRVPAHSPENPRFQPAERGLVPPVSIDLEDGKQLVGRVRFSPHFAGTAAVHGGSLGLLFDDLLGRLANSGLVGRVARTAYLHIDYRRLVPVATELSCRAWIAAVDGRKRTVRGVLSYAGEVVTEAEGLWIEPRPDNTGDHRFHDSA
ncbi:hypothetical protein FF36_03933 [Frankia torreyi]|uniref:Thioesterase domain-containing protein n=2 Tax=Frankia TaxID=1854 RepID=A0A0D8BCR4_9ACTN|nr:MULTISPECIES: hotdog domain-containing protein [Frankia]KJE21729.1 hypothetical protein FF36_03933 [Frankia torreyi]KQM03276.1 hypothetical protein FF86_104317 [Frankia sp. CpI1-P]